MSTKIAPRKVTESFQQKIENPFGPVIRHSEEIRQRRKQLTNLVYVEKDTKGYSQLPYTISHIQNVTNTAF